MARKIIVSSKASIKRSKILKAMINKPLELSPVSRGITKRAMKNLKRKT